jgi:beta-glucanase (GH16 family)
VIAIGFTVSADAASGAASSPGGPSATVPSTTTPGTSTTPPITGSCPSGQRRTSEHTCVRLPRGTSTLSFDDEFNGKSVNSSLWDVLDVHGDRSNSEPECYLPADTSESAGSLHELLKVKSVTCPIDGINGGSGTLSADYASGAIQMRTFNFTYGTVKVRAKFTGGTGPWPAVWLLGADCQQPVYLESSTCDWPNTGSQEIDLAEILQGKLTSVNEGMYFNGSTPDCRASTTNVSKNWHVYTLVWSPTKLLFRIDSKTTCKFTSSIPSTPMFLIVDTAVGGVGGGPIRNSTLPQSTQVDYVRVFQ